MNVSKAELDAAVNVKLYRSKGWIKFNRNLFGKIKGIWVKDFPSDVDENQFLSMFCASNRNKEDEYIKIKSHSYEVKKNKGLKGGYNVVFV